MSTEPNKPALEKMSFSRFQKHYTAYRRSEIPSQLIDLNDAQLELPDRSSLYTIRNFLTLSQDADGIYPDTSFPLISHEEWRKFLHIETAALSAQSHPYPFTDRYTYMPGRYRGLIQAFFAQNRDFHNTLDDTSVDKASNVLACHEFAPYLGARFQGNMAFYRKFELVFRAILNKVVATQYPRYHYIHIPLSDKLYTRPDFVKTVLNIAPTTLKGNEDPSYYVLIHLIGFLFNEVASENNVRLLPNDVGFLDPLDPSISKTNSLFNRLPQPVLDTLNLVFTHAGKAVIYNLGDLKAFTTSTAFVDKVIKHLNILKMVSSADTNTDTLMSLNDSSFDVAVKAKQGDPTPPASDDTDAAISLPDEVDSGEGSNGPSTSVTTVVEATPVKKPIITPPEAIVAPPKADAPNEHFTKLVKQGLDRATDTAVAQATGSKDTPVKRARTLYAKHMQAVIGGRTIAEHLAEPDPKIEENHLDFLSQVVPEESMTKSAIANLDGMYIKHMATRDVAKVITSFVQHGYFVSDVKESLESDQFSRKVNYRVKLVDLNGKQHSLNFTLPHVDENGMMLINGVVSRMVKQNVNLPICKVSEDRVNLSSNYNKTLVTRIQDMAHNYSTFINKYLTALMKAGVMTVDYGKLSVGTRILPYEYTAIAQRYLGMYFGDYHVILDFDERLIGAPLPEKDLVALEGTYGTYCGTGPKNSLLFWDQKDVIHQVTKKGEQLLSFHLIALLNHLFGNDVDTPPMLSEWTELKILSLNLPIVLVLGFQYGLRKTLDYIHLDYTFVPSGQKVPYKFDQIRVKFADGTLVFSRYPLARSLIAAGLNKWDLSKFTFMEFDSPDVYYALLAQRGISQNYLKGISAFFDFFIDPITLDILQHMHEPTNVRDLLLRATEMLTTMDHREASSMANHRMRGYERMASTLYNEAARALATFREKRNQKSGLSINPKAVFERITGDGAVINTEVLNPIHEMKGNAHVTYSGSGGRTSQSFVVQDRVYAKDAVGILSESTPDSGKVAMTTYASVNPRLKNIRGMVNPNEDNTPLDPSNILSTASMLIPGLTQDDGKRASFCSIQLSHQVPCANYEVGHVRTGYEKVVAHRVSDSFAVAATADGKVVEMDDATHLMTVEYDPLPVLPSGAITVPFKPQALQLALSHNGTINIVIGASELSTYPLGKVLSLTKDINGKVISYDENLDVNSVPADLMKTRPDLLQKIKDGTETMLAVVTLKLMGPTYPAVKSVYQYGPKFTPVSGSYMRQDLMPNVVVGSKIKRGDILIYNAGFFSPDRGTKQVSWNHGIMATIALIETSETLEDGSVISKALGERLTMSPSHKRSINLLNTSVIKQMVSVGDQVETVDPLITFIEKDLDILTNARGSEDSLAFLMDLEKKSPKAKYHGHIAEIDLYYACPFEQLSPSLQALAKSLEKKHRKIASAVKGTSAEAQFQYTPQVPVGMKYHGVEFLEDTVLLEFTISEKIVCGVGDKCVLGAANKTVVSSVMEEQFYTKSGMPVDGMYGCVSGYARIVNSMYIMGIGNRVMSGLQAQCIDDYFA